MKQKNKKSGEVLARMMVLFVMSLLGGAFFQGASAAPIHSDQNVSSFEETKTFSAEQGRVYEVSNIITQDHAGNFTTIENQTLEIKIDKSPPVFSGVRCVSDLDTYPANFENSWEGWTNQDVICSYEVTDPNEAFNAQLKDWSHEVVHEKRGANEEPGAPQNWPVEKLDQDVDRAGESKIFTDEQLGTYELAGQVSDYAQNMTDYEADFQVRIDKTVPLLVPVSCMAQDGVPYSGNEEFGDEHFSNGWSRTDVTCYYSVDDPKHTFNSQLRFWGHNFKPIEGGTGGSDEWLLEGVLEAVDEPEEPAVEVEEPPVETLPEEVEEVVVEEEPPACVANCDCAETTPVGNSCSNGCGGSCDGLKPLEEEVVQEEAPSEGFSEPCRPDLCTGNPATDQSVVVGTQTWSCCNSTLGEEADEAYTDGAHGSGYGKYYAWSAGEIACPVGWKVPSVADFTTLGENLKRSEFGIRFAGYRNRFTKKFFLREETSFFWTSDRGSDDRRAKSFELNRASSEIVERSTTYVADVDYSVRCMKE